MHNTALIRQICGIINQETDQETINELLLLLNSVILNDLEDTRLRMEYIRRTYAIAFSQPTAADIADGGSHD